LRAAPLGALKWFRRQEPEDAGDLASAKELASGLTEAAEIAGKLSEQLRDTPAPSQPVANAASICRWELMLLRERLRVMPVERRMRPTQGRILRHLDAAGAAAATLSRGYRFHDLDCICRGGEALDENIDALARIRIRLAA
jgi:hypothetical protein